MTDTTNHAMTPERIAKLRNQIGLGPDDACDLLDALDALTRELDDQERSHLKTIDQRDAAEDALGDAYALVTGNQPEWSSAFGYANALEDIDATIAAQSARIATLEEALDKIIHNSDIWSEYDMARFARAALAPKEAQG